MRTDCSATQLVSEEFAGHQVVGAFDRGEVTSKAGVESLHVVIAGVVGLMAGSASRNVNVLYFQEWHQADHFRIAAVPSAIGGTWSLTSASLPCPHAAQG
jgi:hypothetical protein